MSGWTIAAEDTTNSRGIQVSVSSGLGIISLFAAETTFPQTLDNLPPNTTLFIFALLTGSTVKTRAVDFTFSIVDITSSSAIKLACVTTGAAAVSSIDNTCRDLIGFEAIIKQEIDEHRHRGTPSKIDLKDETKNQLPGARIEGIDAEKITSGVFDVDRVPLLDHNTLKHNGILTHEQLDSFVKTLSQSNKELLGEISSVNLMKQILFLKYKFPNVDEHMINALFLIPGISPNSFIDFESSTANIDLLNRCISGLPPKVGQFFSILFDNDLSFNNAFEITGVSIFADEITLLRDEDNISTVDNFENAAGPGADIPGYVKTTEVVDDNISVKAEDSNTLTSEGFFSGKFTPERTFRAVYTRTFTSAQDWSNLDQLSVSIKTISTEHKNVSVFFVNSDDTTSTDSSNYVILAENEITSNADPNANNFADKVFDISAEIRDNVTQFVIFTEETEGDFEFFIDNIFVRQKNLFVKNGVAKFRYSAGAQVTFHSIVFETEEETDTSILVRAKIANSPDLLPRANFTAPLSPGQVFSLDGTDIEIEVAFETEDVKKTPILKFLDLRLLAVAEFNGFDIDTIKEWEQGDTDNITIEADDNVVISTPINVDGLYFSNKDAVSENDDENIGVFGFSGHNLPIAPKQAINFGTERKLGFNGAFSVVRSFNKHFLVADNGNDRIFEINSDGEMLKGFGSPRAFSDDFFPLSSVYNPETGILAVAFTKAIDKESVNFDKIAIFIGSTKIQFGSNDILVTEKKSDNILEILLTIDNQKQLKNASGVTVNFASGAFAEGIVLNETSRKILGAFGMECFVGDFTYVDTIDRPVFVNKLDSGNWIVANSSISVSDVSTTTTGIVAAAPLVEFDPSDPNNIVFSYGKIQFSDFSLGSIIEHPIEDRLVVAGVFPSDIGLGVLETSNISNTKALEALAGFRGIVAIVDKVTSEQVFTYNSPDGLYPSDVDFDIAGNILVSESDFGGNGGRVIKLDSFGNIIQQFGNGSFRAINDAKARINNNILISA